MTATKKGQYRMNINFYKFLKKKKKKNDRNSDNLDFNPVLTEL